MNKDTIAAMATQRALGHLGEGEPSEGEYVTPSEKFIRAIFGVKKTPEEVAALKAANKAAADAALAESQARWADSPLGQQAAARQAAQAAQRAAAEAERTAVLAAKIARVNMVNAAIATLVAEGVLAERPYQTAPFVSGLEWSERRGDVRELGEEPEAWALYKALRDEGTTCPDRAADLLAEICGLLDEPK